MAQVKQDEGCKADLRASLESASAYIVELEDKFFRQQQTSLELLKQLKDVEI